MGLKRKDYSVDNMAIVLSDAYAQVKELHLRGEVCTAVFHIQRDRESLSALTPFEKKTLSFKADRHKNLLEQAYEKAKKTLFEGWEDDIVTEEETAPEASTEEATEWF